MFRRSIRLGILAMAALTIGLMGCASSSDDDDDSGGTKTKDPVDGMSAADSIQTAVGNALGGESGSDNVLTASPSIKTRLANGLAKAPGVRALTRFAPNQAVVSDSITVALDGGPYPCDVSGDISGSGAFTYAYTYQVDTLPYTWDETFSTSTPLELNLNACSDGLWLLDGTVSYAVDEIISVDINDSLGNTGSFSYDYGDSFTADVTGTDLATAEEATLGMDYSLVGLLVGSWSGETWTFTTFNFTASLTLNGESFTCTLSAPEAEPVCN